MNNMIDDLTFKGVVLVTPELATEYLKKNFANRNLNKQRIKSYANDMKNGDWTTVTDGRSLTFDMHGNLLNGQHRLHAIVISGVSIEMFVFVKQIEATAVILNFDTGLNRTAALITHKSSNYISTVKCIMKLIHTDRKFISIAEITNFENKLTEEQIDFFNHVANYNERFFTAGFKSGVILYAFLTNDWTIKDLWEGIATKDFSNPKAMQFRTCVVDHGKEQRYGALAQISDFVSSYGLLEGKNFRQSARESYKNYVLDMVKDWGKTLGI